jgi:hypothetical protein
VAVRLVDRLYPYLVPKLSPGTASYPVLLE